MPESPAGPRLFTDKRGLVISLNAGNIFNPGSAQINPTALPLLNQVAQALAPLHNPIRIEGFTDDELGVFSFELGPVRRTGSDDSAFPHRST